MSYSSHEWNQPSNGVPSGASSTYVGRGGPVPWFRDKMDALRSARVPEAEFPDGYLGTVRTRRQDRLEAHGGRSDSRGYRRGVHVGSRVPPDSYFWNEAVNPQLGLELQAKGQKFAPQGEAITYLVNDGKPGPVRGSQGLQRTLDRLPRARV